MTNIYDYNPEVDKKDFQPVAPGVYRAIINDVTSKEKDGVHTLSIQYKLENNRRLFQNFKMNEKGQKWMQWQLADLGVLSKAKETAKENENEEQTIKNLHNTIVRHFIGKVVNIEVTHNNWKNPSTGVNKIYESVKVSGAASEALTNNGGDDELLF